MGNRGVPPQAGSGSRASHEAADASSPKASIPNAVGARRTVQPFSRAPRDGTAFHIMNTVRFNPLMERYEALTHGDGERRAWAPIVFGSNEPTIFINLVPLEYKVPDGQWFPVAFTATYLCRRKSLWERLVDWLWRLLPSRQRGVVVRSQWRVASAIEAATAGETTQIGSTEGESAVAKPDAQPHPLNPVCKEGGNS